MTMRIRIDTDRCTGHGRCYDIAPALFDADDEDGYGLVKGDGTVPDEHRDLAVRAAKNCPENAVVITDE